MQMSKAYLLLSMLGALSRTDDAYESTYLQVLRNNGDNTFTDVTDSTVTQGTTEAAFGKAVVHDFDQDGYNDVVFRHAMFKGTAEGLNSKSIIFTIHWL